MSKALPFFRTVVIAILISALLLAVISLAAWKLSLKENTLQILIYAVYFISCAFGGFCFGRIFAKRRIIWGIIFGITYFLILLLVSFFVKSSGTLSAFRTLSAAAICALGGIVGAFFT